MDILATYKGPKPVVRKHALAGVREDRVLAMAMAGCAVIFVAQWPRLAREAHLSGEELAPLLAGSLMALLVILPLLLYALAFFVQIVFVAVPRHALSGYGSRLALVWAVLAASPLVLLDGLVAGFMGDGTPRMIVGLLWLAVFLWFWLGGALAASEESERHA